MEVSDAGLMEIIGHEAIVLTPYYDSVGVLTIGVGHTKAAGGLDPAERWGKPLTVGEAIELFRKDMERFSAGVRKAFVVPLTQQQFDAAVSFHFNTGAIGRATWVKMFNAGDVSGARNNFMNWGKPKEIIPRRKKERDLFFGGTYANNGTAAIYPATEKGKVLWSRGEVVFLEPFLKPPTAPETVIVTTPVGEPTATEQPARGGFGKLIAAIGSIIAMIAIALVQFFSGGGS